MRKIVNEKKQQHAKTDLWHLIKERKEEINRLSMVATHKPPLLALFFETIEADLIHWIFRKMGTPSVWKIVEIPCFFFRELNRIDGSRHVDAFIVVRFTQGENYQRMLRRDSWNQTRLYFLDNINFNLSVGINAMQCIKRMRRIERILQLTVPQHPRPERTRHLWLPWIELARI